jgi:hypothetical protein
VGPVSSNLRAESSTVESIRSSDIRILSFDVSIGWCGRAAETVGVLGPEKDGRTRRPSEGRGRGARRCATFLRVELGRR